MQLKDSVFLITGGASGLGAATARVAIEGGAKVVIADLQAELGQKLADSFGASARYIKTDVTSEGDAKAAIELAARTFGGLHVLVNCAGIGLAAKTIGKETAKALSSATGDVSLGHVVAILNNIDVGMMQYVLPAINAQRAKVVAHGLDPRPHRLPGNTEHEQRDRDPNGERERQHQQPPAHAIGGGEHGDGGEDGPGAGHKYQA